NSEPVIDEEGRLRADYKGAANPRSRTGSKQLWDQVTSENLYEMTDFVGYKQEFLRLFGFEIPGVDYEADVDPDVKI
ncbi:trans-2-enoyl-CoA reductase, partial [Klebsiella quasipneumoniae]